MKKNAIDIEDLNLSREIIALITLMTCALAQASRATLIPFSLSPFGRFANSFARQRVKRLKPLDDCIAVLHTAEAVC